MSRLLIFLCLPALWSCASDSEKPEENAQIPAAQYVAERGVTDVRREWLEDNPLPDTIEFFSIVTYPSEERVSGGLKGSYRILAKVDARNDTQVLFYDQMIPGSTLMAYVNADHWAAAVPVARNHPFVANMFVNQNDYPREALLEAIMRYLEEQLTE